VSLRPKAVPAAKTTLASLLATIAVAGCASTTRTLDDPSSTGLTHGSLTDREYNVAVAVAEAEAAKARATATTSATATVGAGTETDPNAGPPCTSGTLIHIKLIGAFNAVTTDLTDAPITTILITADPASGKPCEISVRVDTPSPDPSAAVLFMSFAAPSSPPT
jgi:hypothetical protein